MSMKNQTWKVIVSVAAIAAGAAIPMSALAETHTLQPYAYVQSHGVNRVDTGYCAKALSRYFIDFQLTQASLDNQGIFGNTAENPKCAFYTTSGSGRRNYKWYYRDSGSSASTFSAIDAQRRIMTVTHSSKTEETAVLSLYDRTGAQTKTQTYSHNGTATTSLSLFALGAGNYLAGTKNIYSFEAADSSTATTPAVFLAPATNDVGAAGFYDVVGGEFHGEAQSSPSSVLTFPMALEARMTTSTRTVCSPRSSTPTPPTRRRALWRLGARRRPARRRHGSLADRA